MYQCWLPVNSATSGNRMLLLSKVSLFFFNQAEWNLNLPNQQSHAQDMVTKMLPRVCLKFLPLLCHTALFSLHFKVVEKHGMQCPLNRPFLWEPWGRDQCDNMTCEPALYGLDKDLSDTRVHQTDRGSSDNWAAVCLIHLFGGGVRFGGQIPVRLPVLSCLTWIGAGYTSTHPVRMTEILLLWPREAYIIERKWWKLW